MIRVLIVAEQGMERAGLEAIVKSSEGLKLVGSRSNARDAKSALEELDPDVLVLVSHGEAAPDNGVVESFIPVGWLAAPDSSKPREPALVIVADDIDTGQVSEGLPAGSMAILPLDSSPAEIRVAIEAAAAGFVAIHPSFAGLVTRPQVPRPGQASAVSLTSREMQVLRLISAGLGNKEIAWELHISEHTVKFHIASIFNKLDVQNRAEAVSAGMRLGLIMV